LPFCNRHPSNKILFRVLRCAIIRGKRVLLSNLGVSITTTSGLAGAHLACKLTVHRLTKIKTRELRFRPEVQCQSPQHGFSLIQAAPA
jgi:hypothetical protein